MSRTKSDWLEYYMSSITWFPSLQLGISLIRFRPLLGTTDYWQIVRVAMDPNFIKSSGHGFEMCSLAAEHLIYAALCWEHHPITRQYIHVYWCILCEWSMIIVQRAVQVPDCTRGHEAIVSIAHGRLQHLARSPCRFEFRTTLRMASQTAGSLGSSPRRFGGRFGSHRKQLAIWNHREAHNNAIWCENMLKFIVQYDISMHRERERERDR